MPTVDQVLMVSVMIVMIAIFYQVLCCVVFFFCPALFFLRVCPFLCGLPLPFAFVFSSFAFAFAFVFALIVLTCGNVTYLSTHHGHWTKLRLSFFPGFACQLQSLREELRIRDEERYSKATADTSDSKKTD
jgi:hypothetical protein